MPARQEAEALRTGENGYGKFDLGGHALSERTDPVTLFLRDIQENQGELLSPQDEVRLAQEIQMARAARSIIDHASLTNIKPPFIPCRLTQETSREFLEETGMSFYLRPVLKKTKKKGEIVWGYKVNAKIPESKANEPQLQDVIYKGEQARLKFFHANLRLVVHIARRYKNRGAALSDLIQEGASRLFYSAIDKFEWWRGVKFSTYGGLWVIAAINDVTTKDSQTIRIPEHMYQLRINISVAHRELSQELDREPTDEEMAKKLGLKLREFQQKRALLKTSTTTSLETEVKTKYGTAMLGDTIKDENATDPAKEAEKRILAELTTRALQVLSPSERRVMELRFGLKDGRQRSLAEVGKELVLTRERIRQIEAKALRKLRHSPVARGLRDFFD